MAGASLLLLATHTGRWTAHDLTVAIAVVAGLASFVLFLAYISALRDCVFAHTLADRRAERVDDLLRTVRLVEEMSGIGVWRCDLQTGEQEWSAGMKSMFDIAEDEIFVPGDAETLLFANNVDLLQEACGRPVDGKIYTLDYEIFADDGIRVVEVQARNFLSPDRGGKNVVAVLRDKTDQRARERQLELAREAAVNAASEARKLAETDALTGLANRRMVMGRLDQLIVETRRQGMPLSLTMFDIDNFKSVNDAHGHLHGDRVIKAVSQIAERQVRGGDIVGRIGGEEFVWIAPGTPEATARMISERLRLAVAMGSAVDGIAPVTISLGVAELLEADTSLSLFARADAALYEAKNGGRNRVELAA